MGFGNHLLKIWNKQNGNFSVKKDIWDEGCAFVCEIHLRFQLRIFFDQRVVPIGALALLLVPKGPGHSTGFWNNWGWNCASRGWDVERDDYRRMCWTARPIICLTHRLQGRDARQVHFLFGLLRTGCPETAANRCEGDGKCSFVPCRATFLYSCTF